MNAEHENGSDLARFFALMAFHALYGERVPTCIPLQMQVDVVFPRIVRQKLAGDEPPRSFATLKVSGKMCPPDSSEIVGFSVELRICPHHSNKFVWSVDTGGEEEEQLRKYQIEIGDKKHDFYFSYSPHHGAINIWPAILIPEKGGRPGVFHTYNVFGKRTHP